LRMQSKDGMATQSGIDFGGMSLVSWRLDKGWRFDIGIPLTGVRDL